ncbi:MAG: hypothetical protein ABII85_00260 [Bacillota bacterium]
MIAGVVASQITTEAPPAQVVTPTAYGNCFDEFGTKTVYPYAKNNDIENVTMYVEVNDSTPDISRGTVAPDAYSVEFSQVITVSVTIYAQAKVTGRTDSTVASRYINIGFCMLM